MPTSLVGVVDPPCEGREEGSEVRCYVAMGAANMERRTRAMTMAWEMPHAFYTISFLNMARADAFLSVEQTAAVSMLPKILGDGPPADTVLGGWSMGASFAFDLARLSEMSSDGVRGLCVIDHRRRTPALAGALADLDISQATNSGATGAAAEFFARQNRQFARSLGRHVVAMDVCFQCCQPVRISAHAVDFVATLEDDDLGKVTTFLLQTDEAVDARRALATTTSEVHKFRKTSHFFVGDTHAWDIARRMRASSSLHPSLTEAPSP